MTHYTDYCYSHGPANKLALITLQLNTSLSRTNRDDNDVIKQASLERRRNDVSVTMWRSCIFRSIPKYDKISNGVQYVDTNPTKRKVKGHKIRSLKSADYEYYALLHGFTNKRTMSTWSA